MKTITRTFTTTGAAERYAIRLYGVYDHVRLVRAPRFGGEGVYVWEVRR
jgi:hypothetical protein